MANKKPPWLVKKDVVRVEYLWEDHSITRDTDEPQEGALFQESIGYLKKEDVDKHGNDYVIICQSYDEQGDYSDCLTILKKNIVRQRKLR